MSFPEFIEDTRSYLSQAELEKAIERIKTFLEKQENEDHVSEIITLEARYNRNKKKETLDIESADNIKNEWNKITYALTLLLKSIEKDFLVASKRKALQSKFPIALSNPTSNDPPPHSAEWNKLRNSTYATSKGIQLVHTLWPSKKENQEFDIYIYLTKHKSETLDEVASAEFFFGKMWGNQIFNIPNEDNRVGIYTAAYGPFLCLCKVKFKTGEEVFIHRYIDFEQGELMQNEFMV